MNYIDVFAGYHGYEDTAIGQIIVRKRCYDAARKINDGIIKTLMEDSYEYV